MEDLAAEGVDDGAIAGGAVDVKVGTAADVAVESGLEQVDLGCDVCDLSLELGLLGCREIETFAGF